MKNKEAIDRIIKYIRKGTLGGSFAEGCDCRNCNTYEKKVRKDLTKLLSLPTKNNNYERTN